VASGLVLVDDVFVGNAIDDAGSLAEHFVGRVLVASVDGLTHTLDGGAHHGAKAGVVLVAGDRLAGALTGLGGIGHNIAFFSVVGLTGKDEDSSLAGAFCKVTGPKPAQ